MKNFNKVIKEIRFTLNSFILFDIVITSILIFLSVYLFLSLFNLFPLSALIPAIIYLVIALIKRSAKNKMRIVEDQCDALNEKLRTAADNKELENPVVNELQEEVMHDIKNVNVSCFLNTKRMSYRIFFSIIVAFTIVFVSTFHLAFLDLEYLLGEVPNMLDKVGSGGGEQVDSLSDVNLSDNIYGDEDIAVLGNEEINIKIKPASFKVSVKEDGNAEQKQFDEIFPDDVYVESSESYEEYIPLEEQELVKSYFEKITE